MGGEFGYGVNYENEVFGMHRFCWCEQNDCGWCAGIGAIPLLLREIRDVQYAKSKRLPNFWHKSSGLKICWYKWIGRGTEYNNMPEAKDWKNIFNECIESINGTRT